MKLVITIGVIIVAATVGYFVLQAKEPTLPYTEPHQRYSIDIPADVPVLAPTGHGDVNTINGLIVHADTPYAIELAILSDNSQDDFGNDYSAYLSNLVVAPNLQRTTVHGVNWIYGTEDSNSASTRASAVSDLVDGYKLYIVVQGSSFTYRYFDILEGLIASVQLR